MIIRISVPKPGVMTRGPGAPATLMARAICLSRRRKVLRHFLMPSSVWIMNVFPKGSAGCAAVFSAGTARIFGRGRGFSRRRLGRFGFLRLRRLQVVEQLFRDLVGCRVPLVHAADIVDEDRE